MQGKTGKGQGRHRGKEHQHRLQHYQYVLSLRGTIAVCIDERPEGALPCAGARDSGFIVSQSGGGGALSRKRLRVCDNTRGTLPIMYSGRTSRAEASSQNGKARSETSRVGRSISASQDLYGPNGSSAEMFSRDIHTKASDFSRPKMERYCTPQLVLRPNRPRPENGAS
jgi:hypothetical protein